MWNPKNEGVAGGTISWGKHSQDCKIVQRLNELSGDFIQSVSIAVI
jgi:hypothetical protein